ncbi:hypothetical protein [Tenacibaculum sp. E3R01]|uniref:hypothetical protein n=1 Tax=Tenacibaculum sp. E3R01 TaxID=2267227 RepID=UPI0011BFBF5B|nr:hypothetical protein [Tenacibaculum sp. E3R01]
MKIPPPKSWEEFEELTLDACKIRWENPDLQMNGRQGQPQNGVDIFGSNHIFKCIGVQCKNYKTKVTIELIKEEIIKAESFQPKIDMFYFAISTETDATIQREIRILSQERTNKGDFPVMMLFWNDIIQELVKNQAVMNKHYPQLNLSENVLTEAKNIRLFSILDLVYNTLNLNFYNSLIFGEFGEMAGENPLQIQSVIMTIKYSSSNVLNKTEYKRVSILIDKYKEYMFFEGERQTKFNWDTAELISNEFTGIIEGIEYNLSSKELAIFNIGKILTKWSKWEVDFDKDWPKSSWKNLNIFISQINSEELSIKINEMELAYSKMDHFERLDVPHKIYNEVRKYLIISTE